MVWADILAMSADDLPITIELTPLERNTVLAVLSSMGVGEFVTADESEREAVRDTLDTLVARLSEYA